MNDPLNTYLQAIDLASKIFVAEINEVLADREQPVVLHELEMQIDPGITVHKTGVAVDYLLCTGATVKLNSRYQAKP